jgi:hypothetical protein
MVVLAYFWKLLALAILASFMLSYLGFAQNLPAGQQNKLEFPSDWQTQDFNFSLLEPAAGTPTAAVPSQVPSPVPSPTTPPTGGLATQTFRIEQLPRTTIAPSGTQPVAIPPASAGLSLSPSVTGFRPVSQAFGGTVQGGSVAASLGIIVNEQPVAGAQSGLVGLAAYGPLSGAAPDTLWLRAPQTEQQRRLKAATAKPLLSAALQAAWRLMLLAETAAPQANEAAPNWLAVRAETLEALGQYEAAWGLWREAGRLVVNPTGLEIPDNLQQGWARASLLAGQTADACSLVRAQAAKGMVSDFWPSSAAVCAATDLAQIGAGGGEEANAAALSLAIQLLPPATLQNDPALVAALNAVRDNATPRLGAWPLGSLAGATLAAVPQLLLVTQIAKLPDVALRRLQATPALGDDVRHAAALALAAKTNAPNDAASWLALASSPTLPKAPGASWPDAATLAWAKAYVQAAVADPSATLPPSATTQVVGAALRQNDLTTALSWWGPYRAQEGLSPPALRARWQYYLALQLVQDQQVSGTLSAWSLVRGDDAMANRRTLAVVAGLGQTVAPELWVALNTEAPEQADTLNLAWQNLIMDAARQPDRVAVLAMVSEALRGQNAAALPPAVLQASLAALRAVGLETTAQRLAAEALTMAPTSGPRVLKMHEPLAEALPAALPATLATPTVPTPKAPSVTAPKPPLLPKPKV